MPQLKPYDAGNLTLQPTERGIDAQVQRARRTGAFYNQAANEISGGAQSIATAANDQAASVRDIGSGVRLATSMVEDYLGHREVSAGAAAGAKLFSNLNDQWNSTIKGVKGEDGNWITPPADPNDPAVAAKFREETLEPALQKFSEAYSNTPKGEQWSQSHVASMRNHFFQTTAADMSTLAAEAVRVNVTQLANTSTNTARKQGDTHTVDYLLGQVDDSIANMIDSAPNLKGTAAAKARLELTEKTKEQIVKAGVIGAMEKAADPEAVAKTYADKYPQFINAQEIDQFSKIARYYKNVANSESRAARVQGDYLAKNDFHQKVNKLETDTMPQNAGDPPQLPQDYWQRLRDLSTHPGAALEPGRLKTMVDNGEAITRRLNQPEPLGRVSHYTTMQLIDGIRTGKITDTGAVYQAYGEGKLNRADFNFAVNEVRNLKTPEGMALGDDRKEFFKRYAATVDGAMDMGGHSALGSQRMYQFEMDARRQETDLRKAGQDPHSLYDPSSPNFLGKQVPKYHVSFQEAQKFEKQVQGERKALQPTGMPPAKQSAAPAAKEPVVVSKEQYDALPSGSNFTDRTGKKFVKP